MVGISVKNEKQLISVLNDNLKFLNKVKNSSDSVKHQQAQQVAKNTSYGLDEGKYNVLNAFEEMADEFNGMGGYPQMMDKASFIANGFDKSYFKGSKDTYFIENDNGYPVKYTYHDSKMRLEDYLDFLNRDMNDGVTSDLNGDITDVLTDLGVVYSNNNVIDQSTQDLFDTISGNLTDIQSILSKLKKHKVTKDIKSEIKAKFDKVSKAFSKLSDSLVGIDDNTDTSGDFDYVKDDVKDIKYL